MKDLIAKLEALEGGAELAKEFTTAWTTHSTALDTAKGEAKAAKSAATKAAGERDAFKADLDKAKGTTDERVTALTAERDQFKAESEKAAARLEGFKLRSAVASELGISDKVRARRAVDAFMGEYLPEGASLDDNGGLVGAAEAIENFKKAEPFYFAQVDPGHGGGPAGGDPRPGGQNPGGKPDGQTAIQTVQQRLASRYPSKGA